jgi:hypothetical protein
VFDIWSWRRCRLGNKTTCDIVLSFDIKPTLCSRLSVCRSGRDHNTHTHTHTHTPRAQGVCASWLALSRARAASTDERFVRQKGVDRCVCLILSSFLLEQKRLAFSMRLKILYQDDISFIFASYFVTSLVGAMLENRARFLAASSRRIGITSIDRSNIL